MPFHKLADGPITMTIGAVRSSEGKFGPQVVFSSTEGTDVFISELSAHKGLARLNLDTDTVVGKTLYFEQIKKDGKTFTNINLGSAGAVTATTSTAAPARPAATPALSFDDAVALYAKCVQAAVQHLGKTCEQAEIPVDGSAIQAAAATLFISTKGR